MALIIRFDVYNQEKNPAGGFNIYTLGDIIEMTYLSVLINGKVFRKKLY